MHSWFAFGVTFICLVRLCWFLLRFSFYFLNSFWYEYNIQLRVCNSERNDSYDNDWHSFSFFYVLISTRSIETYTLSFYHLHFSRQKKKQQREEEEKKWKFLMFFSLILPQIVLQWFHCSLHRVKHRPFFHHILCI